ncbi:MAG: hypothetical protein KA174_06030 [Chitinophagales bacterium]|jgi:hypothetical protein|nr:hypothetical protein [Chitinophagales bacterium]
MKYSILITLFIIIGVSNINAQTPTIKFMEFTSTKNSSGDINSKPGKELKIFTVPPDERALRMYIQINISDFSKVKVKNKLHLAVRTEENGNEVPIHDWFWNALTKNQVLQTDCYFPAGNYTISLVDNDNPQKIFITKKITVMQNTNLANKEKNDEGFPYNRAHFKIWTCKSVDDNWKAIGQTNKIKAGTCINLFFESTDKLKNFGSMRWGIFKIKPNGSEEYVNQIDQGIGQLELWRRLTYEECDAFSTPGKYRIYISTKDDADAYFAVNNKNYFAKVDLTVE